MSLVLCMFPHVPDRLKVKVAWPEEEELAGTRLAAVPIPEPVTNRLAGVTDQVAEIPGEISVS